MLADLQTIIIRKKQEMGLNNQDIAEEIGLCERSVINKIRTGDWNRDELIKLFSLLHMTDAEILKTMRKTRYRVKVVKT